MEPSLRRSRQIEALALLLQNRGAECATMDLSPYAGVKAMCLRAAGRELEARAMVDSLRAVAADEGNADPVYSDVLPVQELAAYYAWIGDAEASLRYVRLAFARSPVGVDQRIVQSGVFDPVREAAGFSEALTRLQDEVWPRVVEQRKRQEESAGSVPLAERARGDSVHGG